MLNDIIQLERLLSSEDLVEFPSAHGINLNVVVIHDFKLSRSVGGIKL